GGMCTRLPRRNTGEVKRTAGRNFPPRFPKRGYLNQKLSKPEERHERRGLPATNGGHRDYFDADAGRRCRTHSSETRRFPLAAVTFVDRSGRTPSKTSVPCRSQALTLVRVSAKERQTLSPRGERERVRDPGLRRARCTKS